MYEVGAMVYMLHLVGCIILTDKFHVYIDVGYISLFTDFMHLEWIYGCVALKILYIAPRKTLSLR